MAHLPATRVTAVLGPTNTGKTHLAVDRLCAHVSGMMGFPLRLLAREIYDRVAAAKGREQVALITGEEKILPQAARYFLCTAESMPLDREVAFLALDEIQMGADPERGHIFTDRLLHARGYQETMLLGAGTMRPLVQRLLPDAEVIARPRFSTLTYAGARKLARLPKRSAIVAFTSEDAYAIAEMLRRHKGGAAVVMGALSPRTRNAQVAMFQSGEVDYLVATDAIGMGLNMDIAHVAFASLTKFDGRRRRRLTVTEMAQIAGRAGRHQRDGTFGMVHLGQGEVHQFEPDEIAAIEGHSFPPLDKVHWRNANLRFDTIDALLVSLERASPRPELVRNGETGDLAVLRSLAAEAEVQQRAQGRAAVTRLWAAAQLPDYRNAGAAVHARLVARLYRHLSEGRGTVPNDWIAGEVARLDKTGGDIEALSDRIAAIRTWTYVSHHPDWLDDAAHWAGETRRIEDKLSDALHDRLMQRFVDRRTAILLRDLKSRLEPAFAVDDSGAVRVGGEAVGHITGLGFNVDPAARHDEKRLVLAAADRGLRDEIGRRVMALSGDDHDGFAVAIDAQPLAVRLLWRGEPVALLAAGVSPLRPQIRLDASALTLAGPDRKRVATRLGAWLADELREQLGPLAALDAAAQLTAGRGGLGAAARGVAAQLVQSTGCVERAQIATYLDALDPAARRQLRLLGVRIGAVHVFLPALLKPQATLWRLALWAVLRGLEQLPPLPAPGLVSIAADAAAPAGFYTAAGFWRLGRKAVRVDMVERLADAARELGKGRKPFTPPDQLMSTLGLSREDFARLMTALGYRRRAGTGETGQPVDSYRWSPRRAPAPDTTVAGIADSSPFAALRGWRAARA